MRAGKVKIAGNAASGAASLSKCLPNQCFPSFYFDTATQKYYHARLMSAQAVIDSLEFARAEQGLQGNLPVSGLARLQDCLYDSAGSVEFELAGGRDAEQRPILSLNIKGLLHLRCQRCLGRLDYPLQLSNTLLLVRRGENLADAVADPDAPDYIEASTELDVAGLIEDEILLCLPLAPRHAQGECPDPAEKQNTESGDNVHPFSRLKDLKKILESKR